MAKMSDLKVTCPACDTDLYLSLDTTSEVDGNTLVMHVHANQESADAIIAHFRTHGPYNPDGGIPLHLDYEAA